MPSESNLPYDVIIYAVPLLVPMTWIVLEVREAAQKAKVFWPISCNKVVEMIVLSFC